FLRYLVLVGILKHIVGQETSGLCIVANNIGQPVLIIVVVVSFFSAYLFDEGQFFGHVSFFVKSESNFSGISIIYDSQHPDRSTLVVVEPLMDFVCVNTVT